MHGRGGVRGIGIVAAGPAVALQTRGQICHGLIHVSDWLPTLCGLAGCDLSGSRPEFRGKPLDGVDAWGAINGGAALRTEIVHDLNWVAWAALRMGDMKILRDRSPVWQLYNVSADPGEQKDLSSDPAFAAVKAKMLARVAYWEAESKDVVNQNGLPADPRSNPMLNPLKAWLPWLDDE